MIPVDIVPRIEEGIGIIGIFPEPHTRTSHMGDGDLASPTGTPDGEEGM